MANPFLLVETPRAGELNHRFVCSPGSGLTSAAARDLVAAALGAAGEADLVARGPDFVAVIARGVFQARSDRRGNEVLLLGGVDPARLDTAGVTAALAARLGELGPVAAEAAEAGSRSLLVEHHALGRWLQELPLDASVVGKSGTNGGLTSPRPRRFAVLALAAVLIGAGAAIRSLTRPSAQTGSAPPPGATEGVPRPVEGKRVSEEAKGPAKSDLLVNALVTRRRGTENDIRKALDEDFGTNWDEQAGELHDDLNNGQVDPCFADRKDKDSALNDLFPNGKRLAVEEALAVREYLRAWRGHLAALRAAGRKAGLDKVPADKLDKLEAHPTIALVAELASCEVGEHGRQEFTLFDHRRPAPPVLPWLNAADRKTAKVLRALLIDSSSGKTFAVKRLGFNPNANLDLRAVLAAFHKRAKLVNQQFDEELGGGFASRETLDPVATAVGKLTDALKPEGTVQLPKSLQRANKIY
jgi:hypothetical protein